MDAATLLRQARNGSRLTQTALASSAGTSQATLSAYESGRKQPSAATLSRLLAAAGWRLQIERASRPVRTPAAAELAATSVTLGDVLELAAALPSAFGSDLGYPRLPELVE